ncbi:aldo-keto reductase family 1 member C13 [Lepidopterella palustris CBS 459.81]|uniref:Aldo-keto reductase family 1 member C13 n=1 Tax=Lepidopterella palustris CBS 459.81 TaxID=1314670 RepID=A0A8E2JCC6_9PEZI|nr:aldo-keto reductase family 1 member C13 [Lepidopterella palustris CBS 459.81]
MAHVHTPIPALKLNDGNSIPVLGYGTGTAWYKSGDEDKIDRNLVESVKLAIKMEYTHLDGAEVYKTEPELGLAIKESGVSRDKLFVTTKVMRNIADIKGAIKNSLRKLQLEYVDLYLIHSPFFAKSDSELQSAWATMEEVQKAGLAKSIGVSNYLPQHIEATLKTAKVVPACNQIEFHPYLQHSQLVEVHKKHGIATVAYGPLTAVTKAKPGPVDEYMASLAKKYAVSEGEISLRWCIDQDVVAITTSAKDHRLSDYLRATTFKLTPAEIKKIKELGEQKHFRGFWQNKFDKDDRS